MKRSFTNQAPVGDKKAEIRIATNRIKQISSKHDRIVLKC